MEIPSFDTGLTNFYQAHVSDQSSDLRVLTLPIDSLALPHAIRLVKIDAEGHELPVLRGMKCLLERDHPVVIAEASSPDIVGYLNQLGYEVETLENSSNYVFRHSSLPLQ